MILRRGNETRIFSILHLALLRFIPVLLSVSVPVNGSAGQETTGRTSKRIIERLGRSQDISIVVQNVPEAPLIIKAAKAKEISGITYQMLTGASTALDEYTSFPTVVLINNKNLRVTGFVLAIRNQLTDRIHVVKVSGLTIEPGGRYSLTADQWVRSEHRTQVKLEGGEIKSESAHVRPGLGSPRMWLPGYARDLHIVVGIVEFADGSQWNMEPDK